jgi:hypothetical protein
MARKQLRSAGKLITCAYKYSCRVITEGFETIEAEAGNTFLVTSASGFNDDPNRFDGPGEPNALGELV